MLIGYARVSTPDQSLDTQLTLLNEHGCERCYQDQVSGGRKARPGLSQVLDVLRAGDTLVVWKLDRLGRTVKQLVELIDDLEARQINFKSLTEGIDTSTPAGRFFFHMMASLAQMERELTRERTLAALAVAKAKGRLGGRPRKMNKDKLTSAKALLNAGHSVRSVAHSLGVSVPTVYHWFPASSLEGETVSTPTAEFSGVCAE